MKRFELNSRLRPNVTGDGYIRQNISFYDSGHVLMDHMVNDKDFRKLNLNLQNNFNYSTAQIQQQSLSNFWPSTSTFSNLRNDSSFRSFINDPTLLQTQVNNDKSNLFKSNQKRSEVDDAEEMRKLLDKQNPELSPYEDKEFDFCSEQESKLVDITNSDEDRNNIRGPTPEYEIWLEEALENEKKLSSKRKSKRKNRIAKAIKKMKLTPNLNLITPKNNKQNPNSQKSAKRIKRGRRKKANCKLLPKNAIKTLTSNSNKSEAIEINNEKDDSEHEFTYDLSNLVENDLENVPYEDLVKHYHKIQQQLKDLNQEENSQDRNGNESISDDDDLIQLRLLALNSKKVSKNGTKSLPTNDSQNTEEVINPQILTVNEAREPIEEEDDEEDVDELRAILLKSLMQKKSEDTRVLSNADHFPSYSNSSIASKRSLDRRNAEENTDQIDINFDSSIPKDIDSNFVLADTQFTQTNKLMDCVFDNLHSQKQLSTNKSKLSEAGDSEQHIFSTNTNAKSKVLKKIELAQPINQTKRLTFDTKPEPTLSTNSSHLQSSNVPSISNRPFIPFSMPNNKFVIHFGEDSSSDEDDQVPKVQSTADSPPLSRLDCFLREARSNIPENLKDDTVNDDLLKLTNNQEDYQKLKEVAAKKARSLDAIFLETKENRWKKTKALSNQSRNKIESLKVKIAGKRLDLKKAQLHTRKLHNLYIAATKQMNKVALELDHLNKDLKSANITLMSNEAACNELAKECLKLGNALKGKNYKLPTNTFLKKQISSSFVKDKRIGMDSSTILQMAKNNLMLKSSQEREDTKKRLLGLEKAVSHRIAALESPKMIGGKNDKNKVNEDVIKAKLAQRKGKYETALKRVIDGYFKNYEFNILCSPFEYSFHYLNYQLSRNDLKLLSSDIVSNGETITEKGLNLGKKVVSTSCKSVLSHLHAYRLSSCYEALASKGCIQPDYFSPSYSNSIYPYEYLCHYDLMGKCNDDQCKWQHKDRYLFDDVEKVIDILLYNPKVTGFTGQCDDVNRLKEHLRRFIEQFKSSRGCFGENEMRYLVQLAKTSLKGKPLGFLERSVSRLEGKKELNVSLHTFHDFKYNIKIRDRSLVLTYGKIYKIKANVDPDIYIKNRFFAPEGRPISAELETTLASEPNNISLWINLAYYHATRDPTKKADCINRALNVLSRALEANKVNMDSLSSDNWDNISLLWEHFLLLYANRTVPEEESPSHDLMNVCKKATIFCPHFRVWKQYLSLCISFKDKEDVSNNFLNAILSNQVQMGNEVSKSHFILELILYKVKLYLDSGQKTRAYAFLREYCLNQYKSATRTFKCSYDVMESLIELNGFDNNIKIVSTFGTFLTRSDRVYAWLCYIHILYTGYLPFNTFSEVGQGFCSLGNKNIFILDWIHPLAEEKSGKLYPLFRSAIIDCYKKNDGLEVVLPLISNCILIDETVNARLLSLEYLMKNFPQEQCIYLLAGEICASNGLSEKAINILKGCFAYEKCSLDVLYAICLIYYENNQYDELLETICKVVSSYYIRHLEFNEIGDGFDLLMSDNSSFDHPLRVDLKVKIIDKSNTLWLCYLYDKFDNLFQIASGLPDNELESLFGSALNFCKLHSETKKEAQFNSFWCLYIKHFMRNIYDKRKYKESIQRLRHCCLSLNDKLFQVKLIEYLASSLVDDGMRFNLMIDFVKLLPENTLLLSKTLRLGLKLKEKEKCYDLVKFFFISKKYVKYFEADHWKSVINLAIDCKDHLNAHRYFQLALSNNPYDCSLWKLMLTYETSLDHLDHMKDGREILNKLELPLNAQR